MQCKPFLDVLLPDARCLGGDWKTSLLAEGFVYEEKHSVDLNLH